MRTVLLALVLLLAIHSSAHSQYTIGLYADSLGVECALTVPYPGPPVQAYVVGEMYATCGWPAGFRLVGLPEGWGIVVAAVSPTPTVLLGDLLSEEGLAVVFAPTPCASDVAFVVTVLVTPTSIVDNVTLRLEGPVTQQFGFCGFEGAPCGTPCPQFCNDNGLGADCRCFETLETIVNGPDCQVSVGEKSWGQVKQLFDQ